MRKELTQTAKKLRNNRQTIIGRYILDFVCFEKKLIIEIDGGQHADNEDDKIRDEWFKTEGFEVLRFWNNDVSGNRDGVVEKIVECLNSPSLSLPTRGRESLDNMSKYGKRA